jgi:multiple sugar transport system substrate-binding protein/sn-glycerol 3-phosphate transport system substrate-binding protein
MSRKTLSIFMLVVLVFSLALTACQPKATEEPTQEEAVPTEPEEMEEEEPTEEPEPEPEALGVKLSDLDGTTVIFWHVWGEDEPAEGIMTIVEEFNATNEWGITVEALDQGRYSDLEDAMNATIQSGDVPDLVVGYANAFASWYDVDAIVDLNPYLEEEMVGLTEEQIADFQDGSFSSGLLPDGTRISMPFQQSANVIYYNQSWAQELGFDNPPATTAEIREQTCAAAEANNNDDNPDNDGTGGLIDDPGASQVASWVFAFGGSYLNEEGEYDFTAEPVVNAAEYLNSMVAEGCAFDIEGYANEPFATRRALFATSSTAGLPYQQAAFEEEDATDDEWELIPFVGPEGNKAVNSYTQSMGIVNTTPEKKLAAWLFIKHFLSPETQATWVSYSEYYPIRDSVTEFLEDYKAENPKWARGLELTQYGVTEPSLASYSSVRRAIGDAFAEIDQAPPEDIPAILEDLNETAAELVAEMQ